MKVLVTGANGHLGFNLVQELLAAGHTVRASVRGLSDADKVAPLRALDGVELVEADVANARAVRMAMDGMEGVMHAAAVYALHAPGQEDRILSASIDGVEVAMRAARDAGVAKIVLTSSIVALPMVPPHEPRVDESRWATDLRVPYIRAKTLAERLAWDLAAEFGLNLATILPGMCGGPGFQRPTPSVAMIDGIMRGALDMAAPPINVAYVDARDVARAHVLAMDQDGQGRFIAVNDAHPMMADIAHVMREIDPRIPVPRLTLPDFVMPAMPWLDALSSRINGTPRALTPELAATMRGLRWKLSNAKLRRELGWAPRHTLRESLAHTMEALRAPPSSRVSTPD